MGVLRSRRAGLIPALVVLPLALALVGCGTSGDASDDAPADEGPEKARAQVQIYLNAMIAKDTAAGRPALCTPMHETFDRSATGPNGDFAEHFEVAEAVITDVRARDGGGQEVSTLITTVVSERSNQTPLLFTVVPTDQGWCISDERPGTNATGSPAPASSAPAAAN